MYNEKGKFKRKKGDGESENQDVLGDYLDNAGAYRTGLTREAPCYFLSLIWSVFTLVVPTLAHVLA